MVNDAAFGSPFGIWLEVHEHLDKDGFTPC
jgi:hypothetical protein